MRKIALLITILILADNLIAQQQNDKMFFNASSVKPYFPSYINSFRLRDTTISKQEYLEKSKTQRITGFVVLGGGVVVIIVGTIVASHENFFSSDHTGETIVLIGAGISLISIPIFISSRHNAHKAAALSFQNQNIIIPQQSGFVFKVQPALTLKIGL